MVQFRHISTSDNVFGSRTIIRHPELDGNPNAVIVVSQLWGEDWWAAGMPIEGVYNPSEIGVQYLVLHARWSIVNLNGTPMPSGAKFSIYGRSVEDGMCFVHRVSSYAAFGNATPLIGRQFDQRAVLFVTRRLLADYVVQWRPDIAPFPSPGEFAWDYGGATLIPDVAELHQDVDRLNHSIGVWYNERVGVWNVFNQDFAEMDAASEFNVCAIWGNHPSGIEHVKVCVARGGTANYQDVCLDPCTMAGFVFIVTSNVSFRYSDLRASDPCVLTNVKPAFVTHPFGVWFNPSTGRTSIMFEDGKPMPRGAGFNVVHFTSGT